jgi:hypothetical protein
MKNLKRLLFTMLAILSIGLVDAKTINVNFNGTVGDPVGGNMGDGTDAHISVLCGCTVFVGDVINFYNNYGATQYYVHWAPFTGSPISSATWNIITLTGALGVPELIYTMTVQDNGYTEVIRIYPSGAQTRQTKYKIDFTPTKTVSFSASTNGSLTAEVDGVQINSGDKIEVGKDVTFTATPSTGYKVSAWYLNSGLVSGNTTNTLVVTNIQANTTVSVEFEIITFPVTFSMSAINGSLIAEIGGIEINSGDIVEYGSTIDFTVTPDAGYQVKSWKVNGSIVTGNKTNQHSLTATSATSVVVEFETILSVSNREMVNLSVYPNPTVDYVNIEGIDVNNVKIFNLNGQLLINTTDKRIDVTGLNNGIYILMINDTVSKKFVKN